MKKLLLIILVLFLVVPGCKHKKVEKERMCSRINLEYILSLFPQTVTELEELVESTKRSMNHTIESIDDIQADKRTFANTIRVYDRAKFDFLMNKNVVSTIAQLSDKIDMQVAGKEQLQGLDQYEADVLQRSAVLYQALKEYEEFGTDIPRKTFPVKYFLQRMFQNFKQKGIELPVAQRAEVNSLEKDIGQLSARYVGNVVHDSGNLVLSAKDLQGVPQSFIHMLPQDRHGDYIVPLNKQVYSMIMQNCQVEPTRREYFLAYGQRAYPQNVSILKDLLNKRHELAQKVGFTDFSTYQLQDQMLKHPKRAEQFLWTMVYELQKLSAEQFDEISKELPYSVTLTKYKKLKPWDEEFVKVWYRDKHFGRTGDLSAYFELQHTLKSLFDLCQKLLHVEFELQDVDEHHMWAPGIICYRVRSLKSQTIIGYIFFDLFKRDYKQDQNPFSLRIVPTIKDDCSIACVGASAIIANFDTMQEDQPTLLSLENVKQLFAQIAHSLHDLLGATCFVDFSGTQVAKDFVNAPSQMFVKWLDDPKALQSLSRHYKTGAKLPLDVLHQLLATDKFDTISTMLHKVFIGLVGLHLHKHGYYKGIHKAIEKLHKKVFRHIAYEPEQFIEYNTIPLASDAALSYADVWSHIVGTDLLDHVKHAGMNYDIGKEYMKHVLHPGGFASPTQMMKRFFKRPTNHRAFFKQFAVE